MKNIITFLILFYSFQVLSFNDSLKTKRLTFMIESGFGTNLFGSNPYPDTIFRINSANRKKINIGGFYQLNKSLKIRGFAEYYKVKMYSVIAHEFSKKPLIIKHYLKTLKLGTAIYKCLLHDNKSTLYIGLGFGWNKRLTKFSNSNYFYKRINNQKETMQFTSALNYNSFTNVNLGLLYEYKFDKMSVGYKLDFTSESYSAIPYEFNISNHGSYKGYYTPESINLEASVFLTF